MNEKIFISDLIREYYPSLVERELVEEMASVASVKEIVEGEIIMDIGSYIKYMPLLIEGVVKVMRENEDGNEIFLYYLSPGESCTMSYSCCMMDRKSNIRAIALENSRIIGIPTRYMDSWMRKYASWRRFIMLSYDNRMNEMLETIDSIAFKKMDQRLLEYLNSKSAAHNTKLLSITHQEIANNLNASREAISRLLKQLEKKGILKLGRNKITLLG